MGTRDVLAFMRRATDDALAMTELRYLVEELPTVLGDRAPGPR